MNVPFQNRGDWRYAQSQKVINARGERWNVNPDRVNAAFQEVEWTTPDTAVEINTLLLANRECPWRCVMCDLWKGTLTYSVTPEQITHQIRDAIASLPQAPWIKLYNSGSFFDRAAIPEKAHAPITQLVQSYDNVIVENHPRLVRPDILDFAGKLDGSLEVAMGLESANPEILRRLNKGFDLKQFADSCNLLHRMGIRIRAFVLIYPPWTGNRTQARQDMVDTARFANECGVGTISLVPVRGGDGFLASLEKDGHFREPDMYKIRECASAATSVFDGRLQIDLWDIKRFSRCSHCEGGMIESFEYFNRFGKFPDDRDLYCAECGSGQSASK